MVQQRVHNPAYTNYPLPRQIQKFESDSWIPFSNSCVGGIINTILVSIISVTFILGASKVSFLNYL